MNNRRRADIPNVFGHFRSPKGLWSSVPETGANTTYTPYVVPPVQQMLALPIFSILLTLSCDLQVDMPLSGQRTRHPHQSFPYALLFVPIAQD